MSPFYLGKLIQGLKSEVALSWFGLRWDFGTQVLGVLSDLPSYFKLPTLVIGCVLYSSFLTSKMGIIESKTRSTARINIVNATSDLRASLTNKNHYNEEWGVSEILSLFCLFFMPVATFNSRACTALIKKWIASSHVWLPAMEVWLSSSSTKLPHALFMRGTIFKT